MARERTGTGSPPESVISIIAPGMKIVGDCHTDGTVRVEGTVCGSIEAGKAVVVGRDGSVEGDVITQDAVIAGAVQGTLVAASRLEVQATSRIDGDVRARRMQLEEGAILNGTVQMGEMNVGAETASPDDPGSGASPAVEQTTAEPNVP